MKKIIRQTEKTAYDYLKAFGFEDEQIFPLVEKGKVDLEKTVLKLEGLLTDSPIAWDEVDNALHAIKGLLYHLGNNALAERIDQSRDTFQETDASLEILELLK
jgi:hypothetical protein